MVIAKSDAVILVVSASLLAAGVYRWQSNVSQAYERPALETSSSAVRDRSDGQPSSTNSLAAKPATAATSVTGSAGTGIDAPAETNFGKTEQSSAQNAAVTPADTANQSSAGNAGGQPLYGTYEVRSGDSLSKIAVDYGTTVETLRTINEISGSLITVGQNISYPLPAN